MSREFKEKIKHTWFTKGHTPQNYKSVGEIRIRTNYKRGNTKSVWIKIKEPNIWIELHRHNWERENGPIPIGMLLSFRDGNPLNCKLDNLELVTRVENMKNSIEDLRNHLFETIELLKDGKMETGTVKAITNAAQGILNSAKIEVDFIKAMGGIGEGTGFIPLKPKKVDMKKLTKANKED